MCQHTTLTIEYVDEDKTLWYACATCNLGFHAYRVASTISTETGEKRVIEDWAPTIGEIYPSLSL